MAPYDTEGDADSLTAQCILIIAFAVQGRQTVPLNYRSPQISGLKINEVIKNRKSCPAQTEKNMMKDSDRDSQTMMQTSISVFSVWLKDNITLVISHRKYKTVLHIVRSHSELLNNSVQVCWNEPSILSEYILFYKWTFGKCPRATLHLSRGYIT